MVVRSAWARVVHGVHDMGAEVATGCLGAEDAIELGQLLAFLGDWIDSDSSGAFADALASFCGAGYSLEELRADLARFARLLGADERLIGDDR